MGILAAVVIPQFSNASQNSKTNTLAAQMHTVNSAVAIYRMQHMDTLPDLSTGWTPLITQTNPQGNASGSPLFGPYLTSVPVNAITGGTTISTTAAAGVDWVWNPTTGIVTALDTQGNVVSEVP